MGCHPEERSDEGSAVALRKSKAGTLLNRLRYARKTFERRRRYNFGVPWFPVQIVRFVDEEPQPGLVESQFRDAHGAVHSIIDKVPLFTGADLWSDSDYPQPGFIECRVLERMPGRDGNFARISIEPYCFELTNESAEFVMSEGDLSDRNPWQ
jgi:hypothetical protein